MTRPESPREPAAQAAAAYRAQLRAAVEGLYGQFHPMCAVESEPTDHQAVSRKAVLALLDAPVDVP